MHGINHFNENDELTELALGDGASRVGIREDTGEYEVSYYVVGMRYTFDSFKRMLYAEYRFDNGILFNGTKRKDEITIGFRWDFGY